MMNPTELLLGPRTRQNHALEHATIAIINRDYPHLRLSGHSTGLGFNVFGSVEPDVVKRAAAEALARLQAGEGDLAVHPRCGTNLAVGGAMAGLGSFIFMGRKSGLNRLSYSILASMLAIILSQPVGALVQKHLTTSPDQDGVAIKSIKQKQLLNMTVTEVLTRRA